jgi:hypothetical protein
MAAQAAPRVAGQKRSMKVSALNDFLDQAWSEHSASPAAVAARLPQAVALLREPADVGPLLNLAHHVLGLHLARHAEGLALVELVQQVLLGWRGQPGLGDQAQAAAAVSRLRAGLVWARAVSDGQLPPAIDTLENAGHEAHSASEGLQAGALAASALACQWPTAAADTFAQVEQACLRLPDHDAAVRALAVQANNAANQLAEVPANQRSPEATALMLDASALARRAWGRAGTWLQQERAEYFLCGVHLAAGDAGQALLHARECERIVLAQGADAFELFFALEAQVRAARAGGEAELASRLLLRAQALVNQVAADNQGAVQSALAALHR